MDALEFAIDANWAFGLVLAMTRVGAFVVAAPQLGPIVPYSAKLGFTVAIGWFLAAPVSGELDVARLVGLASVNAVLGLLLGWLLGVLFHMFAMAGSVLDTASGTSIAMVIDPTRGEQGAVFSRLFHVVGLTLFHVMGGLALLVTGLVWSVRAVPLHATPVLGPELTGVASGLVGRLMVAGSEIALPVLAVLVMAEAVLGLAARFAPTANVFLLGMPAKTLLALMTATLSVALFPEAVAGLMEVSRRTTIELLNGVGVG